jgi:hypothetical protein
MSLSLPLSATAQLVQLQVQRQVQLQLVYSFSIHIVNSSFLITQLTLLQKDKVWKERNEKLLALELRLAAAGQTVKSHRPTKKLVLFISFPYTPTLPTLRVTTISFFLLVRAELFSEDVSVRAAQWSIYLKSKKSLLEGGRE